MKRFLLLAAVAAVALFAVAGTAAANNSLPIAPSSEGFFEGGAAPSDGVTPQVGEAFGGFLKGSESYNANSTTTVVDFSLPQGVTIHNDPIECSGLPNNDCLVIEESTCAAPTAVTINGNEIEFQIACTPGESFVWIALVDSLLPAGSYDASIQFKVASYNRVKPGPNMWQIKLPGSFVAGDS